MATLKQGEKNYLEEHSKEKVAFYEKYLNLYLTVLINAQYVKAINIYDIFCGVGIYDGDGSKGSPVVAMECIKNQLKIHWKNRDKPISLLINDGDKTRVNIAKNYIEKNCNAKCLFTAYNLQSNEIFSLVIDKIKKSKKDENHLVFIDPHGYKDIYKNDIVNIMEAGKSEILIFLPIHLMYRFLKPTKNEEKSFTFEAISMGGYSHANLINLQSAKILDDVILESSLGNFSRAELNNKINPSFVDAEVWVDPFQEGLSGGAITKYTKELFELIYLNFTSVNFNEVLLENIKSRLREEIRNENLDVNRVFYKKLIHAF